MHRILVSRPEIEYFCIAGVWKAMELPDVRSFLDLPDEIPVVDVRSPGEFVQGHIPGAYNIPLFDDEERAAVGTIYHKEGSDAAIRKGFELADPNREEYILKARQIAPDNKIRLYCWRGGMRSEKMAGLFHQAGFIIYRLPGGYKAYRRYIRETLGGYISVLVLGGYTGSGKTEILHQLENLGEKVVDLEHLACHKGSVFGALGQERQPTNEQFENDLCRLWFRFDRQQPVWLEDESRMIGTITLPPPVIEKINSGSLICLEVERSVRVDRLVEEYAGYDPSELAGAIVKIRQRLGPDRTHEALSMLHKGDFLRVAGIMLDYYDKAYRFSLGRRKQDEIFTIRVTRFEPSEIARQLVQIKKRYIQHGYHLSGL
jgi:tRNA 2-selenouridine synthase